MRLFFGGIMAILLAALIATVGMFYARPSGAAGREATQPTITITLSPEQCIRGAVYVFKLNTAIQGGQDATQLLQPQNDETNSALLHWLRQRAEGGQGLSPLKHAAAFLKVCSEDPEGQLVLPALI